MTKKSVRVIKKILTRIEKIFCQFEREKFKKVKRKFLTLGIFLLG